MKIKLQEGVCGSEVGQFSEVGHQVGHESWPSILLLLSRNRKANYHIKWPLKNHSRTRYDKQWAGVTGSNLVRAKVNKVSGRSWSDFCKQIT